MTEAEWLSCTDTYRMFDALHGASPRKLRLFSCACCRRIWPLLSDGRSRRAVEVAERWVDGQASEEERRHAALRCIFANPFQATPLSPTVLTWNDALVLRLAQAAYDKRQLPSGHLNPERLAVLADALEEVGCDNSDLLSHLRSPGPHVRGCWAVDCLLAKE